MVEQEKEIIGKIRTIDMLRSEISAVTNESRVKRAKSEINRQEHELLSYPLTVHQQALDILKQELIALPYKDQNKEAVQVMLGRINDQATRVVTVIALD